MSSQDQYMMRHGSRVMAVCVFIIIILSSYKLWIHFLAVFTAIFGSLVDSNIPKSKPIDVAQNDQYAYPATLPFRDTSDALAPDTFSLNVPIAHSVFDKFYEYLAQAKKENEDIKGDFVRVNNYAHRLLFIKGVSDADLFVFERGGGYLISLYHEHITNSPEKGYYLQREIPKLQALQKEIPFDLIVAPPLDYSGLPSDLDGEVEHYQHFFKKRHDFAQQLMRTLPSSIGQINLFEKMRAEGKTLDEMLFRTDHHWRPEAGFWAFKHIASFLKERYQLVFSDTLLDEKNYEFKTYPNALKGSHGKRIEIIRDEYDDFTIITPSFDTDYQVSFSPSQHVMRGAFKEVFLAKNHKRLQDEHSVIDYAIYMGGDYPFIKIKNHYATNNKSVLIVRDSFSCVTIPFMASLFSETYVYDRRFDQQSLEMYVKKLRPDYVIFMLRFPPYLKFRDD